MKTYSGKITTGLIAIALCGVAASLSACNTVEGAGKDIKAAGDGISTGAKSTGDAISGKK
ncbi:MAG: entericidin A/B family lipoprotein [Phycisphaerae bacterium]|nr:entericidin A/B family lipoprotein [Phycisphaerae bacterium]